MRYLLLALAAAVGCASPEGRSPLLPVEFSFIATRSELDSSGTITRGNADPWPATWGTSGSFDGWTLGGMLTWQIGPRSTTSPELRALVRELRARRVANPATIELPVALQLTPALTAANPPAAAPPAAADPNHAHTPDPIPVTDATTQLYIAVAGLLTVLTTYLGRNRIPVMKNYTAEGRARRARDKPGEGF